MSFKLILRILRGILFSLILFTGTKIWAAYSGYALCQGDPCTTNSSCLNGGSGACYQSCVPQTGVCSQCLNGNWGAARCIPISYPVCRGRKCTPDIGKCKKTINSSSCYMNCDHGSCQQCNNGQETGNCLIPAI